MLTKHVSIRPYKLKSYGSIKVNILCPLVSFENIITNRGGVEREDSRKEGGMGEGYVTKVSLTK